MLLWDHPRRCGENPKSSYVGLLAKGSPPQVRGKQGCYSSLKFFFRITPAGAGKTACSGGCSSAWLDHPRRCGENTASSLTAQNRIGSPPQVRGKLYRAAGIAEKYRITPAGAGKTAAFCLVLLYHQDHPRRCGENCSVPPQRQRQHGSPPQVRGKPFSKHTI